MEEALDRYLKKIEEITPLKKGEASFLIEKIRLGDQEARNRFIEANLPLVLRYVKRYLYRSEEPEKVSFLDLLQDGSLILLRVTQKFDYDKNESFFSCFRWWISQSIKRAIEASADDSMEVFSEKIQCHDFQHPGEKIDLTELQKIILCILEEILSERELFIIFSRFGLNGNENHTFKEIGNEMGISSQRVQRIEKRALKKIKERIS